MKQRSAFTIIELVIVLAIIALLAAISVPNSLEAETRSKVSRAHADMRSIAVAIESYAVDDTRYPWVDTVVGYGVPHGQMQGGVFLAGLTTPVAYLPSLMTDPFGGNKFPDDPYHAFYTTTDYWYWSRAFMESVPWGSTAAWTVQGPGADAPGCKWAIMSQGPDMHWSHFVPPGAPPGFTPSAEVDRPLRWGYDTTNGTLSWGNIPRFGP